MVFLSGGGAGGWGVGGGKAFDVLLACEEFYQKKKQTAILQAGRHDGMEKPRTRIDSKMLAGVES